MKNTFSNITRNPFRDFVSHLKCNTYWDVRTYVYINIETQERFNLYELQNTEECVTISPGKITNATSKLTFELKQKARQTSTLNNRIWHYKNANTNLKQIYNIITTATFEFRNIRHNWVSLNLSLFFRL